MTEATTETTENSPKPAAEATNEMAEQVAAAEAQEPQDPNILGKMEPDETQRVTQYKVTAQSLMQEIGRLEIRRSRMQAQVDEVESQKAQMIAQLDGVEGEAQQDLDAIGARFGIKSGEPWQALPDGTVRRVDPELIRAAQAAAQGQSPPQG